jgi:hypothetical protein
VRLFLLVIACAALGCDGDPEESAPAPPVEEPTCSGVGELAVPDGRCIAPGVPVEGCGVGFVHDGDRGCEPILPSAPCAAGMMAAVGEDTCRDVATCADGTWGDIPIDGNTQHVDASYAGVDSDGGAAKPWITIADAIAAASLDAVIAIAAGTYTGDLIVTKRVKLWGRCPSMVEIVGTGALAVFFRNGATGSEIRNIAVTGAGVGIYSGGASVTVEQAWVHDTALPGIVGEDDFGPTELTVRGTLVEQAHEYGIYALGSGATVDGCEVRDTQANAQNPWGRGVAALTNLVTGSAGWIDVRASLISRNIEVGVAAIGSSATIQDSVIRDTLPNTQSVQGRGAVAQHDPQTDFGATMAIRGSLIEGSSGHGIFASGAELTIERSIIRGTHVDASGSGRGLEIQNAGDSPAAASILTLDRSLITHNDEANVLVSGAAAMVTNLVVRGRAPDQGVGGPGFSTQDDPGSGLRGVLDLSASLFERNGGAGVFVEGSDAQIDAVVVLETGAGTSGLFGRGINIQSSTMTGASSSATIQSVLVDGSHDFGILISDATVAIVGSVVRNTATNSDGAFGDGMGFAATDPSVTMSMSDSRIDSSARAGIVNFGAAVTLQSTSLSCQLFDLDSETFANNTARFEDLGGNLCGCPEPTEPCKSVSVGLQPPSPLNPL